jgi:hypothetical protein
MKIVKASKFTFKDLKKFFTIDLNVSYTPTPKIQLEAEITFSRTRRLMTV